MKPKSILPKVSLVGAGPGDPDLISLKGLKAIHTADVILYDALVHPDLLLYASESCRRIFVGKRAGSHRYSQTAINELIVSNALQYGHVVRLKGGDPFIFGRGHEELAYAKTFDIETKIIPGISSVNSVPALQEIPLTKRGINESFWVITGTTSKGEVSKDLYQAVRTDATIVVLMGLRKLREIQQIFKFAGKGHLPVAVIQSGSLPEEKIALGSIADIDEAVRRESIAGPAIILIGEVVALHPDLPQQLVAEYGRSEWMVCA
ncbi:MAG: uroporphyrinogen-III C-methyltransferase [Bacteroidota bacterium]